MTRYKLRPGPGPRPQYDIVDTKTGLVVEGGFFSRAVANAACDEWNERYPLAAQASRTKDNLAAAVFGISFSDAVAKNICVRCQKPPVFNTPAGRKEYRISGLCEPCFNELNPPEE